MSAQLGPAWPAFAAGVAQPATTSVRLHPAKGSGLLAADGTLTLGEARLTAQPIGWHPQGYWLDGPRPTFALDPAWHAGGYYVQEASSMLVAQALPTQWPARPVVLDLCAAPGGKSTLLLDALPSDGILLANETIRSRAAILAENLQRWADPRVVLLSNDPEALTGLRGQVDLVLVDAPCSGEGLWRRDPHAMGEWSPAHVAHCAARQGRILAAALPLLRPGGRLIYSTCTFAPDENEHQVAALLRQYPGALRPVSLPNPPAWGTVTVPIPEDTGAGLACYPHHTAGEGFFVAALDVLAPIPPQDSAAEPPRRRYSPDRTPEPQPLPQAWLPWLRPEAEDALRLWQSPGGMRLLSAALAEWLADAPPFPLWRAGLEASLPPDWLAEPTHSTPKAIHPTRNRAERTASDHHGPQRKPGTPTGKGKTAAMPEPAHDLALSGWLAEAVPSLPLALPDALRYLRGEALPLPNAGPRGWLTPTYQTLRLGWAKAIPGRLNNALPKPFRLRLQGPPAITKI
jgi:16S rRNA C967 or C1407 C5-methylase (RsmB/RsmF family)